MSRGREAYIAGLAQGCNNSIANALELLQSCAKPSIYPMLCVEFCLDLTVCPPMCLSIALFVVKINCPNMNSDFYLYILDKKIEIWIHVWTTKSIGDHSEVTGIIPVTAGWSPLLLVPIWLRLIFEECPHPHCMGSLYTVQCIFIDIVVLTQWPFGDVTVILNI